MELHHLKYFITIAEERSFSKAARLLFVSQSALSQQIASLESEFNVRLFIRGGKQLELSEAGQVLYRYAVQIMDLVSAVHRDMASYGLGVRNTGRLQIISCVGEFSMDQISFLASYSNWRECHPEVECTFRHTSVPYAMRMLELGKADLVVCNVPDRNAFADLPCQQKLLCTTRLKLVICRSLYDGSSLEEFLHFARKRSHPIQIILNAGDSMWNDHIRKHILDPLDFRYTISYEKQHMAALDYVRFTDSAVLTVENMVARDDSFRVIETGLDTANIYTVGLYPAASPTAASFLATLPDAVPGPVPEG